MGVDALRAVATSAAFAALGTPATITPAGDDVAITTTVIWLAALNEDLPRSATFARRDVVRVLSVDRSVVTSLPRDSIIRAAEIDGGPIVAWRVDAVERVDSEDMRVRVLRDPTLDL
jgi:hypothetical protein